MNPKYLFVTEGTTNILNPYFVKEIGEGEYRTYYIPVTVGQSLHLLNSENVEISMLDIVAYDEDFNIVANQQGASYIYISAGYAYVKFTFQNADKNVGLFDVDRTVYAEWNGRIWRPIWNELNIEYQQDSEQQYFRRKLTGKLTFIAEDYNAIYNESINHKFLIRIYKTDDSSERMINYWNGYFFKSDCEFDVDNKNCKVTPSVNDEYSDVLAGMEKEFNLIDLAPAITEINFFKRPITQIYREGENKIACFLGNLYWEQDVNASTDRNFLNSTFSHWVLWSAQITQKGTPEVPDYIIGEKKTIDNNIVIDDRSRWSLVYSQSDRWFYIKDRGTDTLMWGTQLSVSDSPPKPNITYTLPPIAGSGASGNVVISYVNNDLRMYGRLMTDVLSIDGVPTQEIPSNDIVIDHRNYHRIIGLSDAINRIYWTSYLDTEPTKWGKYENKYYTNAFPGSVGVDLMPITRSLWGQVSWWYLSSAVDDLTEAKGRTEVVLRDAYSLGSVLKVLLAKVAPNIQFNETTEYSEFLFGDDPLKDIERTYFISPKSNVMKIDYDNPAMNAPITLKMVLDMLRSCFLCYFFIEDNKFRIENVVWFKNGGDYDGQRVVGMDLTQLINTRNQKMLAFGQNKLKFDKPEMTAYYQFSWMDEQTLPFKGEPIKIVSDYVNEEKIERIDVSNFSADVDYIIMNPADISQDGFVLLGAYYENGQWKLPFKTFDSLGDIIVQNPYCAFVWLQEYYLYDLSAQRYVIGDEPEWNWHTAKGVKKYMKQEVQFPCLQDIDIQKLIKTSIGEGEIEKLTINLSSRNGKATLKFEAQ